MKVIKNIMIYDYENFIENGYVVFEEKIIEVGLMENYTKSFNCEIIDGNNKLLMPGLINSHTHIYSTLFRGFDMKPSPTNFKEVLDFVWWRFDKELNLECIKLSTDVYATESLKSGVTSIIDHHASGEISGSIDCISKNLENHGIKHLLCFETSDRFDINLCVLENQRAINLNGYFGFHASMSLSDETLNNLSSIVSNNKIHIHVAESILDEEDCKSKYGKNIITRLDDFNILNEDSILAHCIHIDEEEADLIYKNKCLVALNPTSNMNNAVGTFNYKLLKEKKINILIGTDGLGVNIAKEWQNLYYISKQLTGNPSGVDLMWVIDSLVNSYKYFNKVYGCLIGKIEKDYFSDFLLVDYKVPTPINKNNVLSHVFFSIFDNLKPCNVYTNGLERVNDYKLVKDIMFDKTIAEKLWKRIGDKNEFES